LSSSFIVFFALARRDPSKRQIKPVNTETLLLDDLDDESDAEYVFDGNSDDMSEDSESSSRNGNDSSSSESESGDDGSDSSIRIIGVSRAPTISRDCSALQDAISVPSEAYPVNLPQNNMALDSDRPHASSDTFDRVCMLCLKKQSNQSDEIIECDACKITVHEGCAQREGLLAEPAYEENPTDPFFAQCRQHTDKGVVKDRRRRYLLAYNRYHRLRQMSEMEKKDAYSIDALEDFAATNNEPKSKFSLLDDRLKEKLEYFRRLYDVMLSKREVPYTRPNKVPLFLENSPVAMRMFVAKAVALSLPIELTGSSAVTEASKSLAPGCPVFCPDFISYVLEREKKIEECSKKLSSLESIQRDLRSSDANILGNYNGLSTRLAELNARIAANRGKATNLLQCLSKILPGIKASGDLAALLTPSEVVEVPSTCPTADSNRTTPVGDGGDGGANDGDGVAPSNRARTVCGPSHAAFVTAIEISIY
uniref:PHD domain-containing protein n=1 Tax=Taenia asiatica TaxID=60517 RepID=A0A0R3WDP3_TAEAS